MSKGNWWGGINDEWFDSGPYETREAAIAELRESYGDRGFYIGVEGEYQPFTRDFVEELLELEACDVCDECGIDASDSWPPHVSAEERKSANEKIAAILSELCGTCSVFPIEGTEHIAGGGQ